jgi:hypothetical protein
MTNEQINIAIAEVRGWTDCVFVESLKLTKGLPPPNNPPIYGAYENGMAQLPNYCKDLNAMHEAEKGLPENRKTRFAFMLAQVLDTSPTVDLNDQFLNIHATAIQRAKAFLKTLGKWEE